MKKLITALVLTLAVATGVHACGGMTQIDPPSLQLDAGPADLDVHSVVDDIQGVIVLC